MPARDLLGEIVAAVVSSTPIPDTLDGLDKQSRRKVERQAAERGLTPASHYAEIVAKAKADAASTFDPAAIAKRARH